MEGVSLITICWNAGKTIRRTLESVLGQSLLPPCRVRLLPFRPPSWPPPGRLQAAPRPWRGGHPECVEPGVARRARRCGRHAERGRLVRPGGPFAGLGGLSERRRPRRGLCSCQDAPRGAVPVVDILSQAAFASSLEDARSPSWHLLPQEHLRCGGALRHEIPHCLRLRLCLALPWRRHPLALPGRPLREHAAGRACECQPASCPMRDLPHCAEPLRLF